MKYYVLSDVHNHYTEMQGALTREGFRIDEPDSKIILAGDAFDRGEEAWQVFQFLRELIEKDKLIWIAGNHEFYLMKRYKENLFPRQGHTYHTMRQISEGYTGKTGFTEEEILFYSRSAGFENLLRESVQPFFETEHYVFVHGSLPTLKGKYNPEWRTQPLSSWVMPAGRNGMKEVMVNGIRVPGKTIVCGHSPAAYGNVRLGTDPSEWDKKEFAGLQRLKKDRSNAGLYKPFYGNGVIGIDANCYKTGFVNCIVIND